MKAVLLAVSSMVVCLGLTGCPDDTDSDNNTGICPDNDAKDKATTLTLGPAVGGKVCDTETNSPGEGHPFFYWKVVSNVAFNEATRFVFNAKLKGTYDAFDSVSFLISRDGTYAESIPIGTISPGATEINGTDLQPFEGTETSDSVWILAQSSRYSNKALEFDIKLSKQ